MDSTSDGAVKVVATVNGVALTERDLAHRAKGSAATAAAPGHEASDNVLETLVRDELIYQKGVELGLDKDPEYRLKMGDLEAQLAGFRRQEMATRYRAYVQQHAAVTDADARAYFDQNASFILTGFHVLQIFYKGRFPDIARDHEDLKSGKSFEEVASRRFPALPAGVKPPWDLGELHWNQIPPAWRGVVDRLEPGQFSNVIKGDGDRLWVIQLAGKRVDPAITFETEKDRIVDVLRQQKAEELNASMLAEARAKAKIVVSK